MAYEKFQDQAGAIREYCLLWPRSLDICMPSAEWASWFQAIFGCVAIIVAITIPFLQWLINRADSEKEKRRSVKINLQKNISDIYLINYLYSELKGLTDRCTKEILLLEIKTFTQNVLNHLGIENNDLLKYEQPSGDFGDKCLAFADSYQKFRAAINTLESQILNAENSINDRQRDTNINGLHQLLRNHIEANLRVLIHKTKALENVVGIEKSTIPHYR